MRPSEQIDECALSHARLLAALHDLDDDVVRRASLLPDWTVGHVLTHLARNADSVVRRLDGAIAGTVVEQYAGGSATRAKAIDDGATRGAATILDDLRSSCAAVDTAFADAPDSVWARPVLVGGREAPTAQLPGSRWRETEIHHVDLGLGYGPTDWPASLVAEMLPGLVDGLTERAAPAELAAWALGRGPAPELAPWG